MKATVEIPADIVEEVCTEARRQDKPIEDILPDLVRAGLRARQATEPSGGALTPDEVRVFLTGLREIGAEVAAHAVDQRSAVEILDNDRR